MKSITGYFGYISKKQKVGQFAIKKSIGALPLLKSKLEQKAQKTEIKTGSGLLGHLSMRMFTAIESKMEFADSSFCCLEALWPIAAIFKSVLLGEFGFEGEP